MDEKNTSTALDDTTDDIQEVRDDNGGGGPESIESARKSVREDLELRWVTNLSEERKRFYLIATQERVPTLDSQYLAVTASSSSPERLFSSVGLVKSDFRGSLLDTTLIDVMWAKQAP